jgi:hypothetical protein
VNWPAWSSVASAVTTLWPALCRVFAYAAPGLPRLQMRRGREDIGASSARAIAESGVSTREGGDCRCLARRGFFSLGVEGVEQVVAIEFGESALTEEVALSVATACDSVVGSDFHSPEIVSRSASASIFGDVIFDIFGFVGSSLFDKHCCFSARDFDESSSRDRRLMYSMVVRESLYLHHRCLVG